MNAQEKTVFIYAWYSYVSEFIFFIVIIIMSGIISLNKYIAMDKFTVTITTAISIEYICKSS